MGASSRLDYDAVAVAEADERSAKELMPLPRGFLADLNRLLQDVRSQVKKSEAKDADSAEAEMARQNQKMVRAKARHLLWLRIEKIVRMAAHDSQVHRTAEVDSMSDDEMKLYRAVYELSRIFGARLSLSTGLENETRAGEIQEEALRKLASAVPALQSVVGGAEAGDDGELLAVHILADADEFVWKGGRKLKPRKGEVMNLPKALAEVLLQNGMAEKAGE